MFPIYDTTICRRPPIMTWAFIGINAIVFLLETGLPRDALEQMILLFGVVPARFSDPAWAEQVGFPLNNYWPFVTSLFLHGGLMHLIGNMWTLWIFGDNVEDRMGPLRFLIFYLMCGISSGIVHLLTNSGSPLPAIGASGAIAGVMGAYLFMFPRAKIVFLLPVFFYPLFFDIWAWAYLVYWFIVQLLSGLLVLSIPFSGGGIAFWAHVGGFVGGVILFWPFLEPRGQNRVPEADEWQAKSAWIR